MKISVILAHPNEDSFNHAIANTIISTLHRNQYIVYFHDLYKEKFNPILPYDEISKDTDRDSFIQQYCNEISDSDGIIIIHPNWWGQPPAILKVCWPSDNSLSL